MPSGGGQSSLLSPITTLRYGGSRGYRAALGCKICMDAKSCLPLERVTWSLTSAAGRTAATPMGDSGPRTTARTSTGGSATSRVWNSPNTSSTCGLRLAARASRASRAASLLLPAARHAAIALAVVAAAPMTRAMDCQIGTCVLTWTVTCCAAPAMSITIVVECDTREATAASAAVRRSIGRSARLSVPLIMRRGRASGRRDGRYLDRRAAAVTILHRRALFD